MPKPLIKDSAPGRGVGDSKEIRVTFHLRDRDVPKLTTPNTVDYVMNKVLSWRIRVELAQNKEVPSFLVSLYDSIGDFSHIILQREE